MSRKASTSRPPFLGWSGSCFWRRRSGRRGWRSPSIRRLRWPSSSGIFWTRCRRSAWASTAGGAGARGVRRHWQKTIEFLKILTEHWPAILKERGVIDFAARRNLLLEAQVRVWQKFPPQGPVIAAGSTGTVPAAAELLALVATLPQGMLVLPGLDAGMDAESWDKIGEDHPQFNMKKLLRTVGIGREEVREWPVRKKSPSSINTACA